MFARWIETKTVIAAGRSLALLVVATQGCAQAELPPTLVVETLARQVAPGEPLRVVVRSDRALETLRGSFRGHAITMDRVSFEPGAQTWAGWAMVGLLEEPGPARLEISGRGADGSPVSVVKEITVEDKAFREEHLEVAPKYVEPSKKTQERIRREKARLKQIYSLRTPQVFPAAPFVRPVPGAKTSPFGTRRYFNGKARSPHSGLDLRAAPGEKVLASGPGRVVMVADLYYSGNLVIIDHGGGLFTLYAHLSAFEVGEGERVEAGQLLGLSGATGRVTGPHLHWGAKIDSRPFDPRALLDPVLFGGQ